MRHLALGVVVCLCLSMGAAVRHSRRTLSSRPPSRSSSTPSTRATWRRSLYAGTYNIDPARVALAGASAGGHLAEYVGYAANTPAKGYPNGPGPNVKAVIAFFAWSDLTHPTVRDFYWNEVFFGKKYEEAPALYKEASPITHVSKQSPPTLLLHGTIDTIVPPSQSVLLVEKLEAHNVPYVYAPFLGLYHAFTIDEDANTRAMYFIERFLGEYLVD